MGREESSTASSYLEKGELIGEAGGKGVGDRLPVCGWEGLVAMWWGGVGVKVWCERNWTRCSPPRCPKALETFEVDDQQVGRKKSGLTMYFERKHQALQK